MRLFSRIALVGLAVALLAGCGGLFGLILGRDLGIQQVSVSSGSSLEQVLIQFANYGGSERNVEFAIVISADDTVTLADTIIYEGTFDITFNSSEQITVTRTEIDGWLTTQPSPGGYYYGVFVDPYDEISETSEADNYEDGGYHSF